MSGLLRFRSCIHGPHKNILLPLKDRATNVNVIHVYFSCLLTGPIPASTWVADSPLPHEVLINGLKRGVPPKHRYKPIFW
jgi:hypothetical protein